jgi:hypothetical protein
MRKPITAIILSLVAAFAVGLPAVRAEHLKSVGGNGLTSIGSHSPALPSNTLWYNGDADGVASFVNQNNAQGSQIIYNDFNVTGANGWTIQSVWSNNIFIAGPPASTTATWEIRANFPTGTLIASGNGAASLTPTGFTPFGFTEFMVQVSGLNVSLASGTYFLAVYPDNTNGNQAGNDSTSGANAVGSPPGNNGNLWATQDNHNSFIGPFALDSSAGVAGQVNTRAPELDPSSAAGVLALLTGGVLVLRGRRSQPA